MSALRQMAEAHYRGQWTRWIQYRTARHARYARYVEREGLPCQDCKGYGGHKEVVLDDGSGPWDECGWCEGTGRVTRWMRGFWLSWKRDEKRSRA